IFLNYLPKLGEMSFHYMKKETALKWTGAVAAVSSAGYSYSRALEEAFNTRISDVEEFSDRKSSLLATTHRQIGQIKQKIDEIDAIMRACGAALSKGQIA
ncbi:MAG TPA: hypothetical protein PKE25_01510, partial [Novosphingobium sp.]|nr:hypothetical protein [Novosphingobium sp.]